MDLSAAPAPPPSTQPDHSPDAAHPHAAHPHAAHPHAAHPHAAHPHAAHPQWLGPPPYRQGPAWIPPARPAPAPRPRAFGPLELAAAALITIAADLALWAKGGFGSGGFGMAALFVAVPVTLVIAARGLRGSARLGVVTLLLVTVALRCVFEPTSGTVLSGLGLLAVFGIALRTRRTFVPEALASLLAALAKLPSRVSAATRGASALASRSRLGKVSVLPILVPLGLSIVFGAVFALANPVVAHGLGVAWTAVTQTLGVPHPARIFLWGFSLVAACGLLRPAIRLARGSEAALTDADATPTALVVARNALVAMNVLFLAYNVVDATYLWTGRPPAGSTTQQYAHQGAFWLTIALVMLTGVVGVMFREGTSLAHDVRAKATRTLAYAWMGQGLVLAAGTYRRIAIHIGHSGLSDLRIVGILGTTLVVLGVGLVAWKLHRRRTFTWLLRRQLDAFAFTFVLYAVMPTHLVSARVNVARIDGGEYGPVLHVFRQSSSAESAAEMIPLLHHHDVRIRQGVAALLEQERAKLQAEVRSQETWRERDLASRRALDALDRAAPEGAAALGSVSRTAAKQSLLELSRAANEGRTLEELLSIPTAEILEREGGYESRSRNDL